MHNIVCGIEYFGTNFHGWQAQTLNGQALRTIQQALHNAICSVANNNDITIYCAGRTDKGVHAVGQVINFTTSVTRPLHAWLMGINANLPPEIRVTWLQFIDSAFNARSSAVARRYRYYIYNQRVCSSIWQQHMAFILQPLDVPSMQTASDYLLGEHDFSAFRDQNCQSKSTQRNVLAISITKYQHAICIDITANAFLQHMVRNIVGSLILIGLHKRSSDWLQTVLLSKQRTLAGPTAVAHGLYLYQVIYPAKYAIPTPEYCLEL